MTQDEKIRIGFMIFPGFPMAALTSMIEPLRAANEIVGQEAFAWTLISEDGHPVLSSARVAFSANCALEAADGLDQVFLLSAPSGDFAHPGGGRGKLRRLERHGTLIGAVSGGVFPLARAGLLEGVTASVHWCYATAFKQEFPHIAATDEVIALSPRRATVSGSAAAFDLALHLIGQQLGGDVATEVACWFQHPLMRGPGVTQRVPTVHSDSTDDMLPDVLQRAVDLFASHIEDPINVADVAAAVGLSPRHLERMFRKYTGKSPLHYYRALRMKAARQLVLYSRDSLTAVALAVGYASTTPMIQNYEEMFGIHPAADREKINMFRVRDNGPVPSVA